jgi:pilus assembly protein CpaC
MSHDQLPKLLPGMETRSPDDFELFLEGILEAPRGQRHIQYGHGRYEAAYKNGPTAGQYPCAGNGACGANGCDRPITGTTAPATPPSGTHSSLPHAAAPAVDNVTPAAASEPAPAPAPAVPSLTADDNPPIPLPPAEQPAPLPPTAQKQE